MTALRRETASWQEVRRRVWSILTQSGQITLDSDGEALADSAADCAYDIVIHRHAIARSGPLQDESNWNRDIFEQAAWLIATPMYSAFAEYTGWGEVRT